MRRIASLAVSSALLLSLSGCLGTMIDSPTRPGRPQTMTRVHLLAAPTQINADACTAGLSESFTYVPLWGLAVGILTLGIVVPMTTTYACVATR